MASDTAEIEDGRSPNAGGKSRLLTLDDLDGRTRAAQHVKESRIEVATDLGGLDQLSALERAAVDHVSILDAMVKDASARWLQGEPVEISSIATLVNAFNRSATVLGWQRRSRDVTPDIGSFVNRNRTDK